VNKGIDTVGTNCAEVVAEVKESAGEMGGSDTSGGLQKEEEEGTKKNLKKRKKKSRRVGAQHQSL
jgi:hypothetical protein